MNVTDRTSSEFRAYLELYERAPLLELGQLADDERWRQHPENAVTYIIDRNINYTNVCNVVCTFCAFYRRPGKPDTYVRTIDDICRRIDETIARASERASAGNVYVNRNLIGAVVGVQPFGGHGLSGTGPKAGGPHYLLRFATEQTVTINTAAAGGNANLIAMGE